MKNERLTELLRQCTALANKLCSRCGLPATDKDDLVQEMALALLEADDGHTDSYYLSRAYWRGLDWLRSHYHLTARVRTLPYGQLLDLIDSGRCRRVWC